MLPCFNYELANKVNKINYLVSIVDPVTNTEIKINTKDLFKLFVIVLYKVNNITLTEFPDFHIEKVFKEELPTNEQLLGMCYHEHYWFKYLLTDIKNAIPYYSYITTSSQCEEYISLIYKLNISLWLLTSNQSDKDVHGQFQLMIDKMCKYDVYEFDNETINNFKIRIGITNIFNYNQQTLELSRENFQKRHNKNH